MLSSRWGVLIKVYPDHIVTFMREGSQEYGCGVYE